MERLSKLNYQELLDEHVSTLNHEECIELIENGVNHKYNLYTITVDVKDPYNDKRVNWGWAKQTLADHLGVHSVGLIYLPSEVKYERTILHEIEQEESRSCPFTHVIVIDVKVETSMSDVEIANYVLRHDALDKVGDSIYYAMESYIIFNRDGQLSGLGSFERMGGFAIIAGFGEPVEDPAENYGFTYKFTGTMAQHEMFGDLPDEVFVKHKTLL